MDLATFLNQEPEPLPRWLMQPSLSFDRRNFFRGRTVFYPGSGNDGQPVRLCAQAHAAHAFVYVDYGVSIEVIRDRVRGIGDPGFRGYQVEHEEAVEESAIRPDGWTPHIESSEMREVSYAHAQIKPFGLYMVLGLDDDRELAHGPKRFAILFIGGDGHATYDALYCQADGTRPPYLVVIQDHGLGGSYADFGAGGLLPKIANRTGVYPDFLLVGERGNGYKPWAGYHDTGASPEPGGEHGAQRRLFRREK